MNVCNSCEFRTFSASLREPDGPEGFSPLPNFAGYVRRCRACRNEYLDEQRRIDEHRAAMQLSTYNPELGPCQCPQCVRDAAFDTFRRVGSTDICMRRNCIDARAEGLADCVCKPEDKAFFQELPSPKPFELAILPSKYRNLIFTDIWPPLPPECEKCGALDCTKNHAEFM